MCLPLYSKITACLNRLSSYYFMRYKIWLLIFAILVSACDGQIPNSFDRDDLTPIATVDETIVLPSETSTEPLPTNTSSPEPEITPSATASPEPSLTPSPTLTPTLPAFNVTGRICFPGDNIPPMIAYFEEAETSMLVELPISAGQTTYEVSLDPGTYIAYAWLEDFSRGGLYSRAVPCGLDETCNDHGILPFTVTRVDVLSDIDICDWYAGPFNVPYPVGKVPGDVTGNISGSLTYFTDTPPGLRVVAFNLGTSYWYWVSTMPEQATFTIPELPSGRYHVIAYDAEGRPGGFADANNNLIEVIVNAGETTVGVTIDNWDAPPDAFPPDPTRQ